MTRDIDMLERLQSAERWIAADLAIRWLGCVLLGCCAPAAWWLYRLVHRPPSHLPTPGELAASAAALVGWACGWALIGEGQGLFRRVAVPGRHAQLPFSAPRKRR